MKGSSWTGPLINASSPRDNQDLVQLVFNGRERPGLNGFSTKYLPALAKLKETWQKYGALNPGCFYDQYYLPTAQNATGLMIGRSPMPIAISEQNGMVQSEKTVSLSTFGGDGRVMYTLDGSPPTSAAGRLHGGEAVVIPAGGPSTLLPYDARFLPVPQYLLELASGVWLLKCGVLTSREV